jgi:NAD-dependent SIR2 family protein deacetylase
MGMLSCWSSLIAPCFPASSRRAAALSSQRAAAYLSSSTHGSSPARPLDLERAAELIAAEGSRTVVMAGAGISVSAGIPDFRTPGTGLYDNLQEYGLPHPQAIFDLDFYRHNPRPFQRLCRELWPGNFAPTPMHALFKVLHDKGKLLRCFTQNIDSLETAAGLPADAVVPAHGNFDGAHVVATGAPVPIEEVRAAAFGGAEEWGALAARHGGLVKPDIVFFGENLPRRFFERVQADLPAADLLLVCGTSLEVHPFASLVGEVRAGTPRLLINRERVGEGPVGMHGRGGFDFDSGTDGHYAGDCDDAARRLARLLGWEGELDAVLAATRPMSTAAAS